MIRAATLRAALLTAAIFVHLAVVRASGAAISAHPVPGEEVAVTAKPPAIVIGFVGGFIAHDNLVHSEVQLAARLRKEYPAGVDVEIFENHRGAEALRRILKLLDVRHDGTLTAEEKHNAQIILYGHSWGGSESVTLARALQKDGIAVLLAVQVDSVSKPGSNGSIIPANVAQAANFYQPHGFIHGYDSIRAADPSRTRIIGNFRFDYENSSLRCANYPWYDQIFMKAHIQMECDPVVWDQVESLIRSNLPAVLPSGAGMLTPAGVSALTPVGKNR